MTNAEARCSKSLRPRKLEGSLGRTAQDVHLDSHTAPELWVTCCSPFVHLYTRWVTKLEQVSLWLTSSRSRHGPKCHPCHCPSRCVLKWNCCNDYLTLPVKNDLGNPYFALLLYCILLYSGSSSVNWLAVSCILNATLWETGFKCNLLDYVFDY